jgi:hypothetical protein
LSVATHASQKGCYIPKLPDGIVSSTSTQQIGNEFAAVDISNGFDLSCKIKIEWHELQVVFYIRFIKFKIPVADLHPMVDIHQLQ